MSLQSSHKRIKANMSIPVLEKDEHEANPLKELNETLRRLQNQKHELEKKVLANNWKAQGLIAAVESKMAALQINRPYNQYVLRKCTEKNGRLQKKIDKLINFSFSIENQITLLEGYAASEKTPAYDGSPTNEESGKRFQDVNMTMNTDELREMLHEINEFTEYMQLKSSTKLRRRCQPMISKPFVSLKNNLCKLPAVSMKNNSLYKLFQSNKSISDGMKLPFVSMKNNLSKSFQNNKLISELIKA